MTVQSTLSGGPAPGDPAAAQIAQLCAVYGLVGEMAGLPASGLPDETALIAAYRDAPSVARRRFEALAGETAGFAASAIGALIESGERPAPVAAVLAAELDRAFRRLRASVGA